MDKHNEFIRGARLEKAVLDITKANVNFGTFLRHKAKSIRMDLKVTKSLLALEVGSDYQVIKLLSP